jgi:hypothetical protein
MVGVLGVWGMGDLGEFICEFFWVIDMNSFPYYFLEGKTIRLKEGILLV